MDIEKGQFIANVNKGELEPSTFVVSQKQVKKKKDGKDFCTVTFQDKSGTIEGIIWTDAYRATGEFSDGDFVTVKGYLKQYKGSPQLIVNKLSRVDP